MTKERIAELQGVPPNNSIRATLMHECLEEIERLQAEVERLRCVVLKDHKETCIHHNDKEREDAGCPVCVKAENARLKAEINRRDQVAWDEVEKGTE